MARSLAPVSLLAVLTGCVTQGTYDKLQADYEESQGQLEARNKTVHEDEQAAEAAKKTQAELTTEVDRQKDRVKDLELRIAAMQKELATAVKSKSSLEASVEEMTAALADLQKRREEAEARIAEFRALMDKFKALISAGKLKVKIVDGRVVVVLATDVLFRSGSAGLSKDGKAAISEVSELLASIPKRKFQIEGHTDNVPIATSQYPSNWDLAAARALTVLKTMVEAGMPAERISAASFGDSKPAAANTSASGKAANRRIEIVLVPDLSALPGLDELNRAQDKAG